MKRKKRKIKKINSINSFKKKRCKTFKDIFGDYTGKKYIGNIDLKNLNLCSLKGAPEIVIGAFDVSYNNLKNLKYGPKKVIGNYLCSFNNLKSLKGAPIKVKKAFLATYNKLFNLKYLPLEFESLFISNNKIKELKYIRPKKIKKLNCDFNNISEFPNYFKDIEIENLEIAFNKLKSLKNLPKITDSLIANKNKIKSLKYIPDGLKNVILDNNNISSLEYLPNDVLRIDLSNNNITSLKPLKNVKNINLLSISNNKIEKVDYLPRKFDNLYLDGNKITGFEKDIPKKIEGNLFLSDNKIETFDNFPRIIEGSLHLCDNKIKNFKNAPYAVFENFVLANNLIESVDDYRTFTKFLILDNNNIQKANFYTYNQRFFNYLSIISNNTEEFSANFSFTELVISDNKLSKISANVDCLIINKNPITTFKGINPTVSLSIIYHNKDLHLLKSIFNNKDEIKNILKIKNFKKLLIQINDEFAPYLRWLENINDIALSIKNPNEREELLIIKTYDEFISKYQQSSQNLSIF